MLRLLTYEEKLSARDKARSLLQKQIGGEPQRENFKQYSISKYPAWVTKLMVVMMLILLIAAAIPSMFRLFTAGRDYFLLGIDDNIQAAAVGAATFLLAEILMMTSIVAARVLFNGWFRSIFILPVTLGLLMALVGNWVVAQPHDAFGWIETLTPPIGVMVIAFILEALMLESIEQRHQAEAAYQKAMQQYQEQIKEPEDHNDWPQVYANALRDALRDANSKGRGRTARVEHMRTMSSQDWMNLVKRQLKQENWYIQQPEIQEQKLVPFGSTAALQLDGNASMPQTQNGRRHTASGEV